MSGLETNLKSTRPRPRPPAKGRDRQQKAETETETLKMSRGPGLESFITAMQFR